MTDLSRCVDFGIQPPWIGCRHGAAQRRRGRPVRQARDLRQARDISRTGSPVCCALPLQGVLLPPPRACHAWGSFMRPMRAAATRPAQCTPNSVRSNTPVAAATFPQVYPVTQTALPKAYPVIPNHSRRGRHCRAGHFPAYAKNRSSEISDDLFSLSKNYPNGPVSGIIEETG